ncbi:MAG: Sec-independent protein translocase protein TatB [Woeseiaceae bacterium]|nr:Sec-independent protein translocase protein TatB [Woeseiaceae bacterium]
MSGPSFAEFLLLCVIGLIVLGPKRLPEVATRIGKWVGQARRMTRTLKRQLDEELNLEKQLSIEPTIHAPPHDDDTYSPLHAQPESVAGIRVNKDDEEQHDNSDLDVDPDDEQDSEPQKEA